MIEIKQTERDDILEVHATAPVTDADYRDVLIPAIDEAIARSDNVRLLMVLDARISDFTLGALWDDARLGLKHWRGFDRVAVATGSQGLARAIRAIAVFLPCPVAIFGPDERDAARRWLTQSLGAVHQTDLGDGVLHIRLLGKLDQAEYAEESADLSAFIRRNDRFRLLLDIRDFDGWQGLGAVAEHFRLVRDHAAHLDKAAIVGDAGWQKAAVAVGRRVLGKEARYFKASDLAEAKDWLKTG